MRSSSEWVTALVDDMHERVEQRRNRECIVEIHHLIAHERQLADEIEDRVVVDQPVEMSDEFITDLDVTVVETQAVSLTFEKPVEQAAVENQA